MTRPCPLPLQKQVSRTEQEILNRIKEKEIRVTELKKKLDGLQVTHLFAPDVKNVAGWVERVEDDGVVALFSPTI